MAGTLFGLGLSQRVDTNGKPDAGWLLYLYAANSSTPVDSYQDTALTVLNTWPLAADSSGMLPNFWVADGSYRARATSADGSRTFFDLTSVLAIGASAGAAPSGGVDATTIFQTGDVLWLDVQGTRSGWVRDNGRTIGSATSGATERANADCQSLFTYLWTNFTDTQCPVVGGRGASANADWSANKQITLPDKRGYVPGGLDDMGNSAAGRWANVPVVSGTVTTAGAILGEATHTLSTSEIPSHNHSVSLNDPGHTHGINTDQAGTSGGQPLETASGTGGNLVVTNTNSATTGITVNQSSVGGGGSHNNVQKTVLGTFYRKL